MIAVRQFVPDDLFALALQPRQKQVFVATTEYAESLVQAGPAFSVHADDELIGCVGLMNQWDGYARAYAFLGENAGKHLLSFTRQVKPWLAARPERRIDAAVETDFVQGLKWARCLGFQFEGVMKKYFGARDCALFSMVK